MTGTLIPNDDTTRMSESDSDSSSGTTASSSSGTTASSMRREGPASCSFTGMHRQTPTATVSSSVQGGVPTLIHPSSTANSKHSDAVAARYRDFSGEEPHVSRAGMLKHSALTFPKILHSILSNPDHEDIICWLPHGRGWRIIQQKTFEERVLPLYFRHGRYSSFARQVNGWGFRRITSGSDYNGYYHEKFLRGMPHVCSKMRRLNGNDLKNLKNTKYAPFPDLYAWSKRFPLPGDYGRDNEKDKKPKPKKTPSPGVTGASSALDILAERSVKASPAKVNHYSSVLKNSQQQQQQLLSQQIGHVNVTGRQGSPSPPNKPPENALVSDLSELSQIENAILERKKAQILESISKLLGAQKKNSSSISSSGIMTQPPNQPLMHNPTWQQQLLQQQQQRFPQQGSMNYQRAMEHRSVAPIALPLQARQDGASNEANTDRAALLQLLASVTKRNNEAISTLRPQQIYSPPSVPGGAPISATNPMYSMSLLSSLFAAQQQQQLSVAVPLNRS